MIKFFFECLQNVAYAGTTNIASYSCIVPRTFWGGPINVISWCQECGQLVPKLLLGGPTNDQ